MGTTELRVISGDVLTVTVRDRSTIVGGGGGGYSYNGTGYTNSVTIGTIHHTFHEVWIRCADGSESRFDFTNFDPAVRQSQSVSILLFSNTIYAIKNHSSKEIRWLVNADDKAGPVYKTGCLPVLGLCFLLYIGSAFIYTLIFAIVSDAIIFAWPMAVLTGLIGGPIWRKKIVEKKNKTRATVLEYHQNIIRSGGELLNSILI